MIITPEIEKDICDRILNKTMAKEIVNEFRISYQQIRDILSKNKIKIKIYTTVKVTPEIEKEMCEMYISNKPITEIGNKFNIVSSTVYTYLLKNDIKIRNSCKEYNNEHKYRDSIYKKHEEMRNKLGWYSLNPIIGDGTKRICGYQRHHVNLNDIIYVPSEYNQDIPHNIFTGFNMEIVNTLAYFFLVQQNIQELNKLFK